MSESTAGDQPIWRPSAERIAAANITIFQRRVTERWDVDCEDYPALHRWSVDHPEQFWLSLWEEGGVLGSPGSVVLADGDRMPGARWFPEARLNFAENLLRSRGDQDAVVFWGEDQVKNRLSHGELYRAVC